MKLRQLGNTDLMLSEIGLGCEGFLGRDDKFTQEMLEMAISNGINCMDLYSPDPDFRKRIKRVLGTEINKVIFQSHLCTTWKNSQYMATRKLDEVKRSFESSLNDLGVDSVDIGMIHYVDSDATWQKVINEKILDYALELKNKGVIKHIGLSSHNPNAAIQAIESGEIEVLMFSVNPCYDLLPGNEDVEMLFAPSSYKEKLLNIHPERQKLYDLCAQKGIGITVMKAFGGGDLLCEYSPAKKALTSNQCIHYALTRPAVATVFSGVRSIEQLKESIGYENASENEKDFAYALSSFGNMSWEGHCMYCGHCAPCPKGIAVADVMKLYNLAKNKAEVPETVREHYAALKVDADDCIECGQCEKRCPFGVKIIEEMRKAKNIFK